VLVAADPSTVIQAATAAIDELDKVLPEVYHFLADPTKTSITSYQSGDLVTEDSLKAAATANLPGDVDKDHVTISVKDADTVSKDYILARKSGIMSPVHGETTGYAVKIPIQFNVSPVKVTVTYNDGAGAQQTSDPIDVIKSISIVNGPGEVYLWMLRSADLQMTPTAVKIAGGTGYKFNIQLTNLVGYFRPDMSASTDQVTVHPDGSVGDEAGGHLESP
jgi:hypothetical protein